MNTKGTRLATILGISSVVLATGVGVYAAKNDASFTGAFDKNRPQMMQQFGSGEMMKPPRMGQFGSGEMELPPRMDGFDPEEGMPKGGKENRFGFAFIDEENLTDAQKEEIEKLQEERDEAINNLK